MWALLAIALKKKRGSLKEHMPFDVDVGQAWVAIGGIAINSRRPLFDSD